MVGNAAMRVLILHNAYQQRGGEDAVVEAEAKLLAQAGHHVHVEIVSNHGISSFGDKVRSLATAPYNAGRKRWVRGLIAKTGAEIVHIHNFFPLLSPSIHEAAAAEGVAVVQTLHNFRLICAGAMLLRNGRSCEKCVNGSQFWGVAHRCYRGSLPGSAAVVAMQLRAEYVGTWSRDVHRFIALSEGGRDRFVSSGLPPSRIVVKPNFVPEPVTRAMRPDRNGALFVGRISPEKGLEVLLEAMRAVPEVPLIVLGDGPGLAHCRSIAPPNVQFLGRVAPEQVAEHMSKAQFLVVPSIWEEPFGLTVPEAMSLTLPVIASRIGALAGMITHGHDGMHFAPGDAADLARAIKAMVQHRDTLEGMGKRARQTFEDRFAPGVNLAQLEHIYREAITEARGEVTAASVAASGK